MVEMESEASGIPVDVKIVGDIDQVEFSIGFLTALVGDELIACEKVISESGWVPQETILHGKMANIRKWRKEVDGRMITAYSTSIGKMGQTHSAIETMAFLARCNPDIVILCGIAGSLVDWIHKRDVVVSVDTHWQMQNGISGDGQCDEYRKIVHPLTPIDHDESIFIQRFVAEDFPLVDRVDSNDSTVYNVRAGSIFTWDYVINSERVVKRVLSDHSPSVCVEMEAGGFLGALRRHSDIYNLKYLRGYVVRGISDRAASKDFDTKARRDAVCNAASVAISLGQKLSGKEYLSIIGRNS